MYLRVTIDDTQRKLYYFVISYIYPFKLRTCECDSEGICFCYIIKTHTHTYSSAPSTHTLNTGNFYHTKQVDVLLLGQTSEPQKILDNCSKVKDMRVKEDQKVGHTRFLTM